MKFDDFPGPPRALARRTPTDVSFTDPRPRRVGSAQRVVTAARKRTTSRRLRSRTTGNGASSVT